MPWGADSSVAIDGDELYLTGMAGSFGRHDPALDGQGSGLGYLRLQGSDSRSGNY